MSEMEIGVIMNYFDKIGVAAIQMTEGDLSVGDTIHIKGNKTDVNVVVDSMQVEHKSVPKAVKGDGVGIKIGASAHVKDKVFKVLP